MIMRTIILAILAIAILTGCNATREQVDQINHRIAQTEQLVAQVEQALPAIEHGLEQAEQAATAAAERLEQLGTEKAAAIARQAAAEAAEWRERLNSAQGILTTSQTALGELREQAKNIEVGDPWWLIALQIVGGVAAGAAGAGVPYARRAGMAARALHETVRGVQAYRDNNSTNIDADLSAAQSDATKLLVRRIKSLGA